MRPKSWHIVPTLVLALATIFVVPNTPLLREQGVLIVGGAALVIGALALFARAWIDAGLACVIALGLAIGSLLGPETPQELVVVRTASTLAFLVLSLALLIGPWTRFRPGGMFAALNRARRHIGVTGFFLGLLHTGFVVAYVFEGDASVVVANPFLFLGLTMNLVLGALAFTSWNRFQGARSLLAWNIAHTALFLLWGAQLGTMLLTTKADVAWSDVVAFSAIGLYWLLTAPWALPRLMAERVSGWKQLQRLTWVAYFALVLHGSRAVTFTNLPLAIQLAAWCIVGLVLGSHLTGWTMARRAASPASKYGDR